MLNKQQKNFRKQMKRLEKEGKFPVETSKGKTENNHGIDIIAFLLALVSFYLSLKADAEFVRFLVIDIGINNNGLTSLLLFVKNNLFIVTVAISAIAYNKGQKGFFTTMAIIIAIVSMMFEMTI